MHENPLVIIGAGPAGLAAAHALRQAGRAFRILERGPALACNWSRLYESLRLHTGKHLSSLPGLPFSSRVSLFPSRGEFVEYLHAYAGRFELPVETDCEVLRAQWRDEAWHLDTTRGSSVASGLILATGLISNPYRPAWPGLEKFTGEIVHSVEYQNPQPWRGRRVLVVGVGNSGAEIATELANAGVNVSISIRNGAHVMPRTLFGVPIQYWAMLLERLPRSVRESTARLARSASQMRHGPPVLPLPPWSPLEKPPVIGFGLPQAIRQGRVSLRAAIDRFEPKTVTFCDGQPETYDAVILATGFRATTGFLDAEFDKDEKGFPTADGVRAQGLPQCWLIGHRYATVGALANIRRDAALLRRELQAERAIP